jgi:hypothetical protein
MYVVRATKFYFAFSLWLCHVPVTAIVPSCSRPHISYRLSSMQTINRFLYGPTPEEKVRAWQAKLRAESRLLDREMRQVP